MSTVRSSDDICPKCGEWKNEDYPLCYACSMLERGLVICLYCTEKYYDPKKYDRCYDCHKKEGPIVGPDYPFDLPAAPRV